MSDAQRTRLLWRGRETIDHALSLIESHASIEFQLASEYHHALFRAVYPAASPGALEEIDADGGPELLAKVATINGLEDMEALVSPLRKVRAAVRIWGRARISITVPEAPSDDDH